MNRIIYYVIFAHFLVIATIVYLYTPQTTPKRSLTIKTHVLPPEPLSARKPTFPKPQPTPEHRRTLLPRQTPVPDRTPSLKEPPNVASTSPKQNEKLISLMQQSLNTLNTSKKEVTSTQKTTARTIGKLASEALSFETAYEEELVSYLTSRLSFPEQGEVTLKLTLTRAGSIDKVTIVKATSDRNKSYIEAALSTLSFPSFGSHFKDETTHLFTLTLICKHSH